VYKSVVGLGMRDYCSYYSDVNYQEWLYTKRKHSLWIAEEREMSNVLSFLDHQIERILSLLKSAI